MIMAALVIGFFGSLHCVGMCGPIMFTFVGARQSVTTFGIYHLGRILSYVLIGLFLGFIGYSFQLFRVQQITTIALGASLLLVYAVPAVRNRIERFYYNSKAYRLIQRVLAKNLSKRKKWFISGMANGFIPCGLTYVAAAAAVAYGSLVNGATFMAVFGFGTLPALAAVAFGGSLVGNRLKTLLPRSVSIVAVLSGSILLLRGALMTFPDFHNLVQTKAAGLITICGF